MFEKIITEKNDTTELLKHCFDLLKPWLDKEMYFSMQEKEKNTRINANYNKQAPIIDNTDDGDGIFIEGS